MLPFGGMTRRREGALVVMLAVVTTVAMTYPLAFRLGSGGRVDSEDGLFGIWNVAWVARTLVVDPLGLLNANIYFPHQLTLAFSELNLVAGVLAIPPYWVSRNPYAAHNTVVLLTFMLSVVGAYALVRYLTRSRPAAAVAGVLFAFCPFIFARTAHMQLLMTAGLPFGMLAFHRLVDWPTVRRGLVLGLVLAVTALACGYYALFTGLMIGVAILFYATTRRLWTNRAYWTSIAVAVVTGGGLAGVALLPYLEVGGIVRTLDDARMYSADWRAYLASPAHAHRWLLDWIESWNEVLFPGFLTLGLAAVGLAMLRLPTRIETPTGSHRGSDRLSESLALYTLIGLLACWASTGPSGGLYTLLFEVVPGFGMIRAPARFGICVSLALAVLAGAGVTRLARGRRPGWVAAGIIAIAMVELAVPYPHYDAPTFPAASRMLALLPAGPVAEFPYFNDRMEFPRHAYYMMGSTLHWRPLVNGYGDVIPQDFRAEVNALAGFPTRPAFEILARHQTRYVVLHRYFYEDPDWAALETRLARFSDRLRPILWDNDAWLFEIVEPGSR